MRIYTCAPTPPVPRPAWASGSRATTPPGPIRHSAIGRPMRSTNHRRSRGLLRHRSVWQHDRHYSPQGDRPELRSLSRLSKLGGPAQYADREEHRPSLAARSGWAGEQFEESHRNGRQQYAGEHDVQGDASPVERRIENFLAHPAAADEVVKRPQLRQRVRFVYPAHLRTRKPSGDMMRKLSVTLSQSVFHLLGTSRRRKPSTTWQKPL